MKKNILMFTAGTLIATILLAQGEAVPMAELNDKQIAKMILTINEGEIDAGKIAKSKTERKEVKDFAVMMIDQHRDNIKATKVLAKKEKFSPEKSNTSKDLEKEMEQSNKDLKKNDKVALDRAYMDQQVAMHEKALKVFDTVLIPQAKNSALKKHLEKTRAAVAEHLNHAQNLQIKL